MNRSSIFEKKYNIRVNYDTFSTNEDMYVKIKAGGADYDVLFPSDYIIERMIKEDMLHKLDFTTSPTINISRTSLKTWTMTRRMNTPYPICGEQ